MQFNSDCEAAAMHGSLPTSHFNRPGSYGKESFTNTCSVDSVCLKKYFTHIIMITHPVTLAKSQLPPS